VLIVEHTSGGKAGEGQANKQPFMYNLLNKEQNDKHMGRKAFLSYIFSGRKKYCFTFCLLLFYYCFVLLYIWVVFLFVFSFTSISFFIVIILSFLHILTCIFQAEHVLLSCSPILLKKKYIKDNKKKQGIFASLR
jgi:hypothetical protein